MPKTGIQAVACELPIKYDTYKGCDLGCSFCPTKNQGGVPAPSKGESIQALEDFLNGKRSAGTVWADWRIPIQFGYLSDPFQKAEKYYRYTLQALNVLARYDYPFILTTKGSMIMEPEYIEVLRRCNVVIQVSMVAPSYDQHEANAPSFGERLSFLPTLAGISRRLVVRVQPFIPKVRREVIMYLKSYAEAGVYGIVIDGMRRLKPLDGMVNVGGVYLYESEALYDEFVRIKGECEALGLRFMVADHRLRKMASHYSCCCLGEENLEGFVPNKANMNRPFSEMLFREKMLEPKTGYVFSKNSKLASSSDSYRDALRKISSSEYYRLIMGKF